MTISSDKNSHRVEGKNDKQFVCVTRTMAGAYLNFKWQFADWVFKV